MLGFGGAKMVLTEKLNFINMEFYISLLNFFCIRLFCGKGDSNSWTSYLRAPCGASIRIVVEMPSTVGCV